MSDDNEKRQPRWSRLQDDLRSALAGWDELSRKPKRRTPEEEQLEELRRLLSTLEPTLKEFDH